MLMTGLILTALSPWVMGKLVPTLGLTKGFVGLNIGSAASVQLVKDAQVLISFKLDTGGAFDFAPFDWLA
jgi:hypothetical protein